MIITKHLKQKIVKRVDTSVEWGTETEMRLTFIFGSWLFCTVLTSLIIFYFAEDTYYIQNLIFFLFDKNVSVM